MKRALPIIGFLLLTLALTVAAHPRFARKRETAREVGITLLNSRANQLPIAASGLSALKANHNHGTIARAAEYMSEFGSGTSVFREIAAIAARADHECPRLGMVLDLAARSTSEAGKIIALAESACRTQNEADEKNWRATFDFLSGRAAYATVEEARAAQHQETFPSGLIRAALERTQHRVRYDGSYRRIDYPGGDVPDSLGVCTDVVIRSYRAIGTDLQQLVHEDMRDHFATYPDTWGLSGPDPSIDHRRVPNLQTFFERHGASLTISDDPDDYAPGDLVTWLVAGNLPHIGIVVDKRSTDGRRPLIVHNIGEGPRLEDMLFDFEITGHYRYPGPGD